MLPGVRYLPHAPGVYRFRGSGGRVLYLGRAVDLRRRVASYWGSLDGRRHLRRMVAAAQRVDAACCDSEHEAAWLERNLLRHRKPVWNRTAGEEVPVYVRLDSRPRTPGLTVVHQVRPGAGVLHFGPYLGSGRAQLAVSALHRVLPLAYAGDGLRGAGADLGRARGVVPADRALLLAALERVLDRDKTAIGGAVQELAARRDEAARLLAYERAGTIQAELEALEWLVSEQKVTSMRPVDLDVAGWADGVLVVFEVREGLLRTWSQRRCTEQAARGRVAATPDEWAAFARRNALLAARLRQCHDADGR